jgi:exopolysaccharide biosynthesis protein
MSKATFNILGDVSWNDKAQGFGAPTVKTPSQFYAGNKSYVIVNGGLFFWDNSAVSSGFYYSQSLAVRNGKLLAPNQNYYSEDWVNFWYPTVGAFCQMSDGSFKTTWTYYTEAGVNYSYPSPAANDLGKEPLEVPSASFPAGAEEFDARQAIGGVTVLLKNGEIVNSYKEEMLDVSADSPQPRSAIGITSDNKMVIFVCQGREVAGGGSGFTTAEEAAIMKSLGCTDALNLDGGGSSCMLVNGKETITPSDGKERAVLTAVSIN